MIPEAYARMVNEAGDGVFTIDEIVQLVGPAQTRKAMPPQSMWKAIIPTIKIAVTLRNAMLSRGATGLLVRAAYRPRGGAALSAHKYNAALDLDLKVSDVKREGDELRLAYAEEATRLWCLLGRSHKIGLGLYGGKGSERTWRVHIDTRGCRSWQHAGSTSVHPPATLTIARRLGLDLPGGIP